MFEILWLERFCDIVVREILRCCGLRDFEILWLNTILVFLVLILYKVVSIDPIFKR